MQKIGSSTNTADANGEFTDGDPQTQIPCTWVTSAWLNTLQRELIHLCEEAGITLDPDDDTQVWQAIAALLSTGTEGMVKTVNEHAPDELGNVKLGSAADADIVTSMTDITAGRIPVVGWMGRGVENGTVKLLSSIYDISGSGEYNALGDGATPATVGLPAGAGNTRFAVYAANVYPNQYWVTLTSHNKFYVGVVDTNAKTSAWTQFYNTLNKPTAADTEALPLSQATLAVDLNTLGATSSAGVYYQTQNANATTANHYPIAEAGSLVITPSAYGCQQEYTSFSSGRKFMRGLTGGWNGTNGPWGTWLEYYSPNHKPTAEDIDAYTRAESDALFGAGKTTTGPNNAYYTHGNGIVFMQSVGSIQVGNNATVTVTLPTSFPSGIIGVGSSYHGTGGNDQASFYLCTPTGKNQVQIQTHNCSGAFSLNVTGY